MPDVNSAHMCLKAAAAAVFSHAVRGEGNRKNCGDVQQVAEVHQFKPNLSVHRGEEAENSPALT